MQNAHLISTSIAAATDLFTRNRGIVLSAIIAVFVSCTAPQSSGEGRDVQKLPTDAEVEQYNAQVPAEERIVCREEIPVGTNIPQRRCYFAQEIEEVGRFHREQLRNVLR